MLILHRYIAKTVLLSIGLITLILIGLQVFILFIGQLDDLGKTGFGITQASFFVVLQVPYQVYLFFPMASLLGALVGLGILANHSELIVMRAVGMSISQIAIAVFKAALIVIVLITVLGEVLVPFLSRYANDYKMAALNGGQSLRTSQGVWLRYANDFIKVGSIMPGNILQNITQFHFNTQHHLEYAREIKEIRYMNQQWLAYDVQETRFNADAIAKKTYTQQPWDIALKPHVLQVNSIEPDEMTLYELHRYLKEQRKNTQNVHQYQLAYLQRIIQPITTLVMMLLAIPFIFGPLRGSTMGSKLLLGVSIGFGFHIMNRFFGPVSTVFQWPAELAAFGPTIIFMILGIYLMKRVRL